MIDGCCTTNVLVIVVFIYFFKQWVKYPSCDKSNFSDLHIIRLLNFCKTNDDTLFFSHMYQIHISYKINIHSKPQTIIDILYSRYIKVFHMILDLDF